MSGRGIRLVRLDTSYQLCSAPEFAPYIRKTLENRKPARLSQPALEVLAVIAYYQPVTRAYVDQIRGVDSAYTVGLLLERELIEECGRLAVPGRPILYRTTKNFLRSFGLSSLEELPELPDASQESGQLTLEPGGGGSPFEGGGEWADCPRGWGSSPGPGGDGMRGWIVLAAVLLLLFLLGQLRLGAVGE